MQNLSINAGRCDKVESRSHEGMPNMHKHMHGIAIHVHMAGNTQRCVSTCPKEAKPLDLPARVCKTVLRQNDGLESCPGMQTAHIHVEDVANKSNTSANTSVT